MENYVNDIPAMSSELESFNLKDGSPEEHYICNISQKRQIGMKNASMEVESFNYTLC